VVDEEPKNEQALCEAVISLIGERRVESITKVESVDTVVRTCPAVELRFETPTARFALEHTRIESFAKQILHGKQFTRLLEPLETDLAGRLPGVFFLTVDAGAATVPVAQHAEIRNALSTWIVENGGTLDAEEDTGSDGNCELTARPPSVPFEVTLCRDASDGSELIIQQRTPPDLDALRPNRIREALNRKCPKLWQEKASGRISVLILESDDIALANRVVVTDAVVAELCARNDAPDIIIWARTSTHPWKAWLIKDGLRVSKQVPDAGPFILAPKGVTA